MRWQVEQYYVEDFRMPWQEMLTGRLDWDNMFSKLTGSILRDIRDIQTVETLKWSWQKAKKSFFWGLIGGLRPGREKKCL